nr:ATP-binding protein [Allomuricauda sp.]
MRLFFLFICCISVNCLSAQKPGAKSNFVLKGIPYFQNFTDSDYDAHVQNWAAAQLDNGMMYFANTRGILEFDGAKWRKISLVNNAPALGLAVNNSGTIYIGGINEIGYLDENASGFLEYVSLRNKLEDETLNFGAVRKVYAKRDGIYFIAQGYLLHLNSKGTLKTFDLSNNYKTTFGFSIGDKLYLSSGHNGLEEIQDGIRTSLFSASELQGNNIYGMNEISDGLLLSTYEQGLFLLKDGEMIPFATKHLDFFKEAKIYCTRKLSSGEIALGTRKKGVILINQRGEISGLLNESTGILNGNVTFIFEDRQNGLWLCMGNGISRVEYPSPFSQYNDLLGLKGTVNDCAYFEGSFYALTNTGGVFMDLEPSEQVEVKTFQPIAGMDMQSWRFLPIDGSLLACTAKGIFTIKDGKAIKISNIGGKRFTRSLLDPNRIWVGREDGIFSIYNQNGQWITEKKLTGYQDFTYVMEAMKNGNLWVGSLFNGIYKIEFPRGANDEIVRADPVIKHYDTLAGLPHMKSNRVFKVRDEIVFTTKNGLYSFDKETERFKPDLRLGEKYADSSRWFSWVYEDYKKNIWIHSGSSGTDEFVKGQVDKNGSFSYLSLPFNRFASSITVYDVYFGPGEQTFFHGPQGVVQYDGTLEKEYTSQISALLRKVTLNDSVMYWGLSQDRTPELSYGKNSLNFEYALPSYDDISKNRFQYMLDGYDESWSDWTHELDKEYTNLSEGSYNFLIRGKNVYGQISEPGGYRFQVLPPWYRTWWAYLGYLFAGVGIFTLLLKWRSHHLMAKNQALEKLIVAKTAEVSQQADQLRVQTEQLKELDQAKSRFFANISHEFRTPLTLIQGPIEHLEQNPDERLDQEEVKMIRRNTSKVLMLVNQLLDLSRIDQGKLHLRPTEGDVFKCLRTAAASFNSHAAQRNMDYRVEVPDETFWTAFDRDKLEKVAYNLLSNAFKFSEDGETVRFEVSYEEGELKIQASDSGKGIPEDKLPFIFDRFYQVDNSSTKDREGSGIGLSLSKDLVELMDGTITVSSEEGKGTYFTVQIPLEQIMVPKTKIDIIQAKAPNKSVPVKPFEFPKADVRGLPHILIIEDNEDMRQHIKKQLHNGYQLLEAKDGERGIKMATSKMPDLIITDLMMPKMDGMEVCRRLKLDINTSHIPIIMLTARAGEANKIQGLETGADDYLTKPFSTKELLARAKNLIDQRQRLREHYQKSEHTLEPEKISTTSMDRKFLERLLDLLEKNHADSNFGVTQMQRELAMSKTQLNRKLRALTQESPRDLLRNFRLKRAAQLLAQKSDTVTQIAYQVGFTNLSYFAKCFKELYGVSPSSY